MDQAYAHCEQILRENLDKLQAVADYLVAHENMNGEQFAACMEGKSVDSGAQGTLFDAFANPEEKTEE
jgi:ATP-dependent Zn protease